MGQLIFVAPFHPTAPLRGAPSNRLNAAALRELRDFRVFVKVRGSRL